MLCNHCNHEMPENCLFCTYCGQPLAKPTVSPAPQQKQAHKTMWIAISAGLGAILVAACCYLLISGVILPNQKYKEATQLLESGDFAKAEVIFLGLEDYRDAPEQVINCRIEEATVYMIQENYAALSAMGLCGKFSPQVIDFIQGISLLAIAENDFETACALDQVLAAHSEAHAAIQESLYQKALLLSDSGDNEKANEIFTYLGDYKNSADHLHAHSYTAVQTAAPTCEGEGTTTYTCSCGSSYTEPVAATGHNFTEATCSAPKTCGVCKKTEGAALDHNIVDHVCSRCGAVQITLNDLQGSWKKTWNKSGSTGYEIVTISGSSATIEWYSNLFGDITHDFAVGSVHLTDYGFYAKGTYSYTTAYGENCEGTMCTYFGITKLTSSYLTEDYYGDPETWYKQ